jgi:serine/threonine protein kinase
MAVVQPETKIAPGALLIGKYRVAREIGRGGMAAVYEAEHIGIGKAVAVKVLASELANSAIVIERFFREARAAASVKSPYIVEVYDSGRLEDGRPFIAMEYLDGESLYDRMARVRLIDPVTTVRVISQVSRGLTKAHAAGIVHRDLKPENIHLTKGEDGDEIAKILDFGLAKFYAPVRTDEKTARLTREGAVFGTPAYMSPEQVKGQGTVDHRADLWALGCMAYECLTGRPVWTTDQGVAMTFAAIAAAAPPIPSKMRPDLPASFDEWFKKALERDPNKRFQTAKELGDALAKAFNTQQISLINISSVTDLERVAAQAEEIPADSFRLLESEKPPAAMLISTDDLNGSKREDETVPMPLVRPPGLSAGDLPPTATPESNALRPPKSGAMRYVAPVVLVAAASVVGYFGWTRVVHPTQKPAGPASATASAASASSMVPTIDSSPPPPPEEPKWAQTIAEGQRLLAGGDPDGALKKFADAQPLGGGAVAKAFIDQVKVGASSSGPCKLGGFSHPRMGYDKPVGRPSVAMAADGAIVVWTDDHEQTHHDHAYSVMIDASGHPTSRPRDLTPEGDFIMRPSLMTVDDRAVLLYWDTRGASPGVRARWLDKDGRIDAGSVLLSAPKGGDYWPSMDRAPDGFWVAWQDDADSKGNDLFLRHLDTDLKPLGGEIRATDYIAPDKPDKNHTAASVRVPSVAVAGGNLFVAYALDREKTHLIERMRLGLTIPELKGGGLDDKAPTTALPGGGHEKPKDRELGEVTIVNDDKIDGDLPAMACGKDGCFIVWQSVGHGSGAQAALIDPVKGLTVWRKKFAPTGSHPAIGVSPDGMVEVAFYDSGKVRVAALTRDGVGTTTTFGRVSGDQPRPWISSGKAHGEWYVAWQDIESGHTEAYVARLTCRN